MRNDKKVLDLLDQHYDAFYQVAPIARSTGHPVPSDTRGWSQILVSVITEVGGLSRKKGADLIDGSDVKAANTWEAIDTPRFNGVLKAGRKVGDNNSIESLDNMPFLFLVLWDRTKRETARCRIWVVRTQEDPKFRSVCESWYANRADGKIRSDNFQLHPPRGTDSNIITNTCGDLEYPLLLSAERDENLSIPKYEIVTFDPSVLSNGTCR